MKSVPPESQKSSKLDPVKTITKEKKRTVAY